MLTVNLAAVLPVERLSAGHLTACFTGPRPNKLHGYDKASYFPIVDATETLVSELRRQGVDMFISGGAQGFDQLAFWAVDRTKRATNQPCGNVTNAVYIPFEHQPDRWRDVGLFGKREYACMRRRADIARVLFDDPDPRDFSQAVKRLHGRNHAMVADADIVIALLVDGVHTDWEHVKGGTCECVRYARSQNKPVIAIVYGPDKAEKFSIRVIASRPIPNVIRSNT